MSTHLRTLSSSWARQLTVRRQDLCQPPRNLIRPKQECTLLKHLEPGGERTREGNDLYHEMMASGVPCYHSLQVEGLRWCRSRVFLGLNSRFVLQNCHEETWDGS